MTTAIIYTFSPGYCISPGAFHSFSHFFRDQICPHVFSESQLGGTFDMLLSSFLFSLQHMISFLACMIEGSQLCLHAGITWSIRKKNRCLATSTGNRFNWPWRWGPGHQDFGEFFAKVVNLGEEEEESIGSPGFLVHQMECWEWRLGLGDKRVCSHGMLLREDPRTQKQGRPHTLG